MIDRWLDSLTPRIVRRWAVRVLLVSLPAATAAFVASVTGSIPEAHASTLMMAWGSAMFVAACCFTVAALATCHLRIAGAFSAGFQAGSRGDMFEEERRPALTVVE